MSTPHSDGVSWSVGPDGVEIADRVAVMVPFLVEDHAQALEHARLPVSTPRVRVLLIDTLNRLDVNWSITIAIRTQVKAAIDAIDESAWTPIVYPDGGQADVAETSYETGHGRRRRRVRQVVRRTRLTDPAQQRLWPDWRHHAFITNVELGTVAVDEFHRDHATVELAIRDLKEGAGLEHCPSGRFFANSAWLGCAVLAYNLTRWTARLGDVHPADQLTVTGTVRTRLLALPGRLVNRSRRWILRLPARWPWATTFHTALNRIRSLPLTT